MRRPDSLTTLILLASGLAGGLGLVVGASAEGIVRAAVTELAAAHYRILDACISLFSLGPLQPLLILIWVLLFSVLIWLIARFLWEIGSSCLRTVRSIRRLAVVQLASLPNLVPIGDNLDLTGRIDLVNHDAPIALCYGLWKPRVLVSTGLLRCLRDEEVIAVLLHERAHLLRHDPLRRLVAESLARAFRPLGLVAALAHHATVAQEVNADRAAVHAQGCPTYLAAALLQLLDVAPASAQPSDLVVSAFSPTDARVDALTDPGAARVLLAPPADHLRWSILFLASLAVTGSVFAAMVRTGHVIHVCPGVMSMLQSCMR